MIKSVAVTSLQLTLLCLACESTFAQPVTQLDDGRVKVVLPEKLLLTEAGYSLVTQEVVLESADRIANVLPSFIPVFSIDETGRESTGIRLLVHDESTFPRTRKPYYVFWDSESGVYRLIDCGIARSSCGGPTPSREQVFFTGNSQGLPVLFYNPENTTPPRPERTSWTLNLILDESAPPSQLGNINAAVGRVQARMQDILSDNIGTVNIPIRFISDPEDAGNVATSGTTFLATTTYSYILNNLIEWAAIDNEAAAEQVFLRKYASRDSAYYHYECSKCSAS